MGRAADGKAPKSEIRNPKEGRSPKSEKPAKRLGSGYVPQHNFKKPAQKPGNAANKGSGFGLRISEFFRISDFALRIFVRSFQ